MSDFGAHKNTQAECGSARLIVRDARFTTEYRQLWIQNPVYEIKAESTNDRLSGTARNPRFQERVPAGSAFQAEMLLKVFEGDNGDKMAKELEHALGVLQQFDALGAGGSRGSGRIKIRNFARETIAIAGVTLAA